MFLSKEYVIKKLEKEKQRKMKYALERVDALKKDADICDTPFKKYYEKKLKQAENALKGYKLVGGIPYRPRSGEFYTKNCSFNPSTGLATSYDWYHLGKLINGVYVVNSFHYSRSTTTQYYNLCHTLNVLGVKYINVEAPSGLQNLESSLHLYISRIADLKVAIKYGTKGTKKWRMRAVRRWEKEIETLKKLGVKPAKGLLERALAISEQNRLDKIEQATKMREAGIQNKYAYAKANSDLRTICEIVKLNERRVAKGLPSLIAA